MDSEATGVAPGPAPPRATPPTVRGEMPLKRPAWPTVIAVIALVLAIREFFGAAWGLAAPLVPLMMFQASTPSDERAGVVFVVLSVTALAVSTLLAVGAVMLLCWKRAAVRLLRTYGVVKLTTILLGFGVEAIVLGNPFAGSLTLLAAAPASPFFLVAIVALSLFFVGLVPAFAIFLLVWFSREDVKRDVARWFTGRAVTGT